MIPKACKRLAEVDFPIAAVSRHAAREKSIHHGHPSTLHLWWARRPLASSRAVLMALLLPDPCDEHCPQPFKEGARRILLAMDGRPHGWTEAIKTDEGLRQIILKFIADFANWDQAANDAYIDTARALVKAAHGEEPPLVVDPFAGGGSIPLEALRIGCDAFASDLNPVACLILKVMLEDIPRRGPKLAEELREVGAEVERRVERALANFYPVDPDGAIPVAYLWARTVHCEAPGCGAEIPIYKTPWLSKKKASRARFFSEKEDGQCRALLIDKSPRKGPITFRIARGEGSEKARAGFAELAGTKAKGNNANVICPCCGTVLSGTKKNPRVQTQLAAQRGGADVIFDENGLRTGGARLLAVVTLKPGEQGRHYRLPTNADYAAVCRAQTGLAKLIEEWEYSGVQGPWPVPDEPLPPAGTLGFRVQRYGILRWGDLFTARQKVALLGLGNSIPTSDSPEIKRALSCAFSRVAMSGMSCTRWNAVAEKMQHTFGRQALPIVWDFAEVVAIAEAPGNWKSGYNLVGNVVDASRSQQPAQSLPSDAVDHPLPDQTAGVWFTDPPYYDAVPYADLSDFFLVWLKRILPNYSLLHLTNVAGDSQST